MNELILEIIGIIAALFIAFKWGGSRQKSKQDKLNVDELLKDAKVDNRPDVDRDSLYKGLRGK